MTPSNHSLVHGFSIAAAAIFGLLAGSLIGTLSHSYFQADKGWMSAGGAAVGIMSGVWIAGFFVRRFVSANCPNCGNRMKCRLIVYGDTSLGVYTCENCGAAAYPAMQRWIRVLRSVMTKPDDHKDPTDHDNKRTP